MNRKEIGAAIAATAVICAATLSGAIMAWHGHVSHETAAQKLEPAPYRGLPFTLEEQHLTDWQGLTGGYVAGARKVRTDSIPAIGTPFPATRTPVDEINARWPKEVGK